MSAIYSSAIDGNDSYSTVMAAEFASDSELVLACATAGDTGKSSFPSFQTIKREGLMISLVHAQLRVVMC